MRQLQAALSQGYDGLQLSAQRSSLQVEHGRVLIPLLILLTETTRFMVPHHRQVDLGGREEIQNIFNNIKLTLKISCSDRQIQKDTLEAGTNIMIVELLIFMI